MTTILGIDPGLAETGYGVIRVEGSRIAHLAHGAISTTPSVGMGQRLKKIHSEILEIIARYAPDLGAIESLFFAKNISSALPVAQARGVCLLALAEVDVESHEYSPQEIKRAITGSGRAAKEQVQEMVKFLLSLEAIPKPDHAADALATAICSYHTVSAEERII